MAVAASTKPKSASKANSANPKAKTQLHRRSRTGCYTCRLRRKKCDEGSPMCTACKHLGLVCEYKRPIWWSNNDSRKNHKEDIKTIIKRKKLSEKANHSHSIQTSAIGSPPGLTHSLPTSATFSEGLDRTRSGSIDSHFSQAFDFNSPPTQYGLIPQFHPDFASLGFSPYEVDIKTERQLFVDDIPTFKESSISTFSTFQTPPPPGTVLPSSSWSESVFEEKTESFAEETLNPNFFDFSHGPPATSRQVAIELDDNDQKLLDHFIQHVLPAIFPILESNQHGSVGSDLILPALQSNRSYLHCCLSIAAQHLKATTNGAYDHIDQDILVHRFAAVETLVGAFSQTDKHQEILETALGLVVFQTLVGRLDDGLADIPWHQHFTAATSIIGSLRLHELISHPTEAAAQTPFNMTLTAWIDILGGTIRGCAPTFAHNYRDKHLSANPSLGLRELMGCEDKVMYLISETACLEALKRDDRLDELTLCGHIRGLGEQISLTEVGDSAPSPPFKSNGTLSPRQLSRNITAAFRLAVRIYLTSLVPGFNPGKEPCPSLVEKLTSILDFIPSGPQGFDRSIVWVYLIGGSVSLPGSKFRSFFHDRVAQLGDLADHGSFGLLNHLLRETWLQADNLSACSPVSDSGEVPYVHWRDVMLMKGWDFLII